MAQQFERSIKSTSHEQLRQIRVLMKADLDRAGYLIHLLEGRLSALEGGKPVEEVPKRILTSTVAQTVQFSVFLGYKGKILEPGGLWTLPSKGGATTQMLAQEVRKALKIMTDYREFERAQLSIVTDELIQRYRDDPRLIENLLPNMAKHADP